MDCHWLTRVRSNVSLWHERYGLKQTDDSAAGEVLSMFHRRNVVSALFFRCEGGSLI